jgi:hypothetical protein
VAAPGEAAMNFSVSDLLPCTQENDSKYVALAHTGVTIALGIALYKTAKSKTVQEGIKGFLRRVRSLRLRKRTDAKEITAS